MAGMLRSGMLFVGIVLAVIAIWHPAPRAPAATASMAAKPHTSSEPHGRPRHFRQAELAVVYVVGAVERPGLYRVLSTGRIDDAVRAAGGMLSAADPAGVDLAAHIADGDEVDVPRIGEAVPHAARTRQRRTRTSRRKRKSTLAVALDINAADRTMLANVPGFGPAIAGRIVELRDREGAYRSFDELLDVSGMSPSRLERARPYLVLSAPQASPRRSRPP